tara:strand:- start:30558 stop:31928 length:1371 start_codon:yes stop_codon:yes gene_type:complete
MKKIAMFIAVFAVISCKNEVPVDYTIVSGKIMNLGGELTFKSADSSIKQVINVAEDGTFLDTLRVKKGAYILYDSKNRIDVYVNNGKNINISYNANELENTLSITGEGSEISNYLFAVGNNERELMGEGTSVYLLDEAEYKTRFNEIKVSSEAILNATVGISDEFKNKEKRNLEYAYLNKLDIYERYHAHYAKNTDFKVSEGFLDELKDITFENEEDFMFSENYKNLVTSYFSKQAVELVKTDSIDEALAFLKAASKISKESIKNSLLYNNAKYGITYAEDLEDYYSTFMSASTDEENNKIISESYNTLKTVSKGQPSPKFSDYENYKGGTTSLDDLKGKFVYVDVWATWCGPCKAEIPSLKEVEKQYHGKNIEFVSVSVDVAKDHDKWLKMVEDDKLKGIQLFSDKNWKSDFVQAYLIKGIPRFILIDPNGNIVNSNAPRPSDSKLIDLFNELSI